MRTTEFITEASAALSSSLVRSSPLLKSAVLWLLKNRLITDIAQINPGTENRVFIQAGGLLIVSPDKIAYMSSPYLVVLWSDNGQTEIKLEPKMADTIKYASFKETFVNEIVAVPELSWIANQNVDFYQIDKNEYKHPVKDRWDTTKYPSYGDDRNIKPLPRADSQALPDTIGLQKLTTEYGRVIVNSRIYIINDVAAHYASRLAAADYPDHILAILEQIASDEPTDLYGDEVRDIMKKIVSMICKFIYLRLSQIEPKLSRVYPGHIFYSVLLAFMTPEFDLLDIVFRKIVIVALNDWIKKNATT